MRLAPAIALLAAPSPALAELEPKQGVAFDLAYTAEAIAGNGKRGFDYIDNLDLSVAVQTGETRIFASALYNNGRDFSGSRYPRGWVASNIETGVMALRLYEAWVDHTVAEGMVSLRAGLYDLNSEFDALDASSLFVNPAHGIGTDVSQSGANGPSIFPVTSLALRLRYKASEKTTLRLAVLDGVPGDPARPHRTAIKLGKGDGALLAGELEQQVGSWRLIAGYWRYTARFDDLLDSAVAGTGVL